MELAQWTIVTVFLQGQSPLRREIIRNADRRGKIEALEAAGEGIIENGIHDDVDRMEMPANDRPNLRREVAWLPVQGVVTELKIRTEKETVIGRMRPDEESAELAAVN